eukprot:937675_1
MADTMDTGSASASTQSNDSSNTMVPYTPHIQSKQREILLQALNDQRFGDVTFIIGSEKTHYNVNRIFLSLISPVFEAMLCGHMKESLPNSEVILEDTQPEVFECVIHFAYCNDPKIRNTTILPLIKLCDKYQIVSLLDICHQYLKDSINDSNFCTYCQHAVQLKIFTGELATIMVDYISDHLNGCLKVDNFWKFFQVVFESNVSILMGKCKAFLQNSEYAIVKQLLFTNNDTLLQLSVEAIRFVLSIPNLECLEECLWDMVLQWANHQSTKPIEANKIVGEYVVTDPERKKRKLANCNNLDDVDSSKQCKLNFLKSVHDLIRFGSMHPKYFTKFVEPEQVLSDQESLSVLIYHQQPERGCGSFKTDHRMPIKDISSKDIAVKCEFLASSKSARWSTYGYWGITPPISDLLTSDNLTRRFSTDTKPNQWIEARFAHMMIINQMNIAPTECTDELSCKKVQIKGVNGKWKDIMQLPKFAKEEITIFGIAVPHPIAAIRIVSHSGYLSISHWKLFGRKSDKRSNCLFQLNATKQFF